MTGGSKLDPRGVECHFLGYGGGRGNYKVQELGSHCVIVSRDVIFEEGEPHCTSPSVEEKDIPLFDAALGTLDESNNSGQHCPNQLPDQQDIVTILEDHTGSDDRHGDIPAEPIPIQQMEPIQQTIRCSSRIPQPSTGSLQSREYQQHEEMG